MMTTALATNNSGSNEQEKHTLEPLKTPERSRKSHRELWQATSMTKKPTWQAETY